MLPHMKPPITPIHEPCHDPEDPRLKHIIRPWAEGIDAELALIGVPSDEAVTLGGGRGGAAEGPNAIRQAIKRFGTTYCLEQEIDFSHLRIVDCGDLDVVTDNIRATHDRLSKVITELLSRGIVPITLGGGHDLSFATLRALARSGGVPVGGINVDAHLDLRPVMDNKITSGTPFRRALETLAEGFAADRFVEMGMTGLGNAKVHQDYLKRAGGHLVPLSRLRSEGIESCMNIALMRVGERAFFSIDIDAVQQAYAPGCSAPAPVGLMPDEICLMAYLAGRCPAVKLFDLVEVAPRYDVDGRTARLAVAILGYFFAGFASRTR